MTGKLKVNIYFVDVVQNQSIFLSFRHQLEKQTTCEVSRRTFGYQAVSHGSDVPIPLPPEDWDIVLSDSVEGETESDSDTSCVSEPNIHESEPNLNDVHS